jgi:hypothetical protein
MTQFVGQWIMPDQAMPGIQDTRSFEVLVYDEIYGLVRAHYDYATNQWIPCYATHITLTNVIAWSPLPPIPTVSASSGTSPEPADVP